MDNNNEEELNEKELEEKKTDKVEDTYVPEQLEDDDFEAEKERLKEEKKAKKKAKKKEKETVEYDEEGNPIKKKKKKKNTATIVIVILIILAVIGGIAGWLYTSLNKPENAISDFAIYFNNQDWENVANMVDMRGYLTLTLIEAEADEAESDDETETDTDETATEDVDETSDEEDEEETEVSYMDYDTKYETVYEDLEASETYSAYYDYMMELLAYGEENCDEILGEIFGTSTMTIDSVKSVTKIENTDSLYQVKIICTFNIDGEDYTDTYTVYVAKTDGEYKVVGGYLAYMIFYYYDYYYYYSQYSY